MTRLRSRVFVIGALAAAMLLFSACGGDDDEGGGPTVSPTNDKIDVEARDTKFDVGTIETQAGTLDVTLIEQGSLDHTFVVENADGGEVGDKLAVSSGSDEDSGSFELETGRYDFFCDVPGHRGQGMEGEIVVE